MNVRLHVICGCCGKWGPVAKELAGMPSRVNDQFNPEIRVQECYDRDEAQRKHEKEWRNSFIAECEKCRVNFAYPKTEPAPKRCRKCASTLLKCVICQKDFDSEDRTKKFCSDDCDAEHWDRVAKKNAARFWANVPAGYRDTEIDQLPNKVATNVVLNWKCEGTGLYMMGKTGSGKTRTAYLLARRLIEQERKVMITRGAIFYRDVVGRTMPNGIEGFDEWLDKILNVGVLIIDEVEKLKFTTRVENEFFDLLEHRTSNRLPLIFTSNVTVSKLVKKMGAEFQAATYRRITEYFTPVNFDV